MNRKMPMTIAGIATAAVLALTGCSGSQQDVQQPSAQPTQTTTTSPSTVTSASTESSSTDTPDPSGPTSSKGTDDNAKPAKKEVIEGLTKFYVTTQNLSQDKAKKFASCMVQQTYDKASAQTLGAMRDGDPAKVKSADAKLFGQAGAACAKVLQ